MEELELLKRDWKNENQLPNFSKEEIFKMIRGKSVSVTKSLFLIGLIEVVLWGVFDYFDGFDEGVGNRILTILKYLQIPIFIVLLVWSYYKINIEISSKELIKRILLLRKIILGYVILVFGRIIIYTFINIDSSAESAKKGWIEGYNEGASLPKNEMITASNQPFYFLVIIMTLIFLLILFFIYQEVYGKLLKKLKDNYHELLKIESNN